MCHNINAKAVASARFRNKNVETKNSTATREHYREIGVTLPPHGLGNYVVHELTRQPYDRGFVIPQFNPRTR